MRKFKIGDIIVRKVYRHNNVPCLVEDVFASTYKLSWAGIHGRRIENAPQQYVETEFILEHRNVFPYNKMWAELNAF